MPMLNRRNPNVCHVHTEINHNRIFLRRYYRHLIVLIAERWMMKDSMRPELTHQTITNRTRGLFAFVWISDGS